MDEKQLVEPMKILLVEDNPGDVRLIRETLAEAENFACQMVHVDRLAEALQRLRAEHFDVVLLDLSLPDSRGLSTIIHTHEQAPSVPIVVLTGLDDEALAVSAVREGAQDYLVKGEVSSSALVRCLRHSVERQRKAPSAAGSQFPQRAKPGRVLVFTGVKGGTGTTTVALNVAAALAKQNKSTIAVELRPCHGTFSFQLNHVPTDNLSSLIGSGASQIQADQVLNRLYNFPFGLRVLFGPQKPEEFKDIGPEEADNLIRTLSEMADYCVVDLPSQPSVVSQAVMRQCHFVSMVLERDPLGVQSGKVLLELLNSWGISQRVCGAIVVNRTALFAPMPINEITAQLGCPIVGVAPPAAEALIRANQAGTPIVFSEPESSLATALADIAVRVSADTVAAVQI
jgi:MinD-like ATPase involved in chromosome partitioning or flagellar assembly/FixJ family two-component response regulator